MNAHQLKKDIFDADHPEKQIKAAYQMRYVQSDLEVVHILFRACYEAKDPKLQQEAVRSLGTLKPDRTMETFIKSTHSHDEEKRMRAYYHLGTLSNPNAIDAVLRGLTDPDERVRKAAAVSAGRLGGNFEVINALKRLLNGFEPDSIKIAAGISIDMIKKRMNGKQSSDGNRSFNKQVGENKNAQKGFNKTNHAPTSYTPKGF